jgi:UDP-N-acetylglucosamine--dolichyl-phosphate N-acetylglucosaminephosphotransferase
MLLATLCSILVVAIIGIFDDLIHLRKPLKMVLPVFAALPLVAVKAGTTFITLPFVGTVIDFKDLYPLVIVPIGMTGAANATNILAGFNGLEAGMGLIATSALLVITYAKAQYTACIILVSLLGALIATMFFSRYPSKVFLGDVGTLVIGAVLCSACVFGNCETAGVIVLIPHAIDFFFKITNGLPSTNWGGRYNDGKLHCPNGRPVGLCQFIMKITGGITEVRLVRVLLVMEILCAIVAIMVYRV